MAWNRQTTIARLITHLQGKNSILFVKICPISGFSGKNVSNLCLFRSKLRVFKVKTVDR